MTSMSLCKEVSSSEPNSRSSSDAVEPFLVNDWNLLALMAQNMDFSRSTALSSYNVGLLDNHVFDSSTASLVDQITRLPYFSSGNYSEFISSFALSEGCGQISSALCPTDFPSSDEHVIDKDSKGKKRKKITAGAFDSHSPFDGIQTAEADQQKDVPLEAIKSPREKKDERKQKGELNQGANTRKPTSKQAKDHSPNGDTPKEDYIHVRAKRGQATNSHSLAERVRREKISERMRFLQDLVPGCNKITGKAVMLDEIINYVQSLQQQVEFLSMKLAAVNPEPNFDIKQIISKDVLHSRDRSADVSGPGIINSSYPHHLHGSTPQGVMQAEMMLHSITNPEEALKNTFPPIPSTTQMPSIWDPGFQNAMQMGFIPIAPLDASTELPGSMKTEQ